MGDILTDLKVKTIVSAMCHEKTCSATLPGPVPLAFMHSARQTYSDGQGDLSNSGAT